MYSNMYNMVPTVLPQTADPCFHCSYNQALIESRQVCMLNDYCRIHGVPTPAAAAIASYVTRADRTVYLRNSVFSLIYDNIYLAITDSKLLGWYYALAPEDKRIIQDEGGFHQFLKNHPAIELSKHHVYVKKNFPLCSNTYNQHQDNLHSSYSSPVSQILDPKVQELSKVTWPMANNSGGLYGFKNPQQFANLSFDVELERHSTLNPQSTVLNPDLQSSCLLRESGSETSVNEDFYSILEADRSIVLCVPDQSPDTSQFHSGEPVARNEASVIESIRTTEDRSSSPMTPVCTCDAMVGTEQTMTMSALSQTEPLQTREKIINTEVYMLDLDYLTKEFITIKTERDELLEKVKRQRVTPLARIVNDLKKLETDYYKMREKILSGISLQELKPLSLDNEETADSTFAMILNDFQKASVSSPQQHDTMNDKPVVPSENNNDSQKREITDSTKSCSSKAKMAFTRVSKERGLNQRTDQEPSDSLSSDDWFDAEEDVSLEGSGVQLKENEDPAVMTTDKSKVVSAGLCVTGLPTNVTKTDVMMWFQKYNVSEVHISNLKERLHVAIVTVESQESAEAAVKEFNGLRIKGQTLQVERINSGRSEDQGQSFTCTSDPESSNNLSKNHNQSPSSSSKKKVVCMSPTAQGTFVPQHYGTMGSFDILMSELQQRHPNVNRQRIVDALLELRAKYKGVLSGLPLRTIRDMASDLLARPANT